MIVLFHSLILKQDCMSNYTTALTLLDKLIAKLEANTGGEPLLPEQSIANPPSKSTPQVEQATNKAQQILEKIEVSEKKETQKTGKGEGKKQLAKAQPEKPKLPQGADEDILIFSEIDLRISEIVQCWKHPESKNLYCEKILVGKQLREIASGLQEFVELEDMKGKVIVMANLKPRSLGGFNSNGMVVCASDKDHKKVELIVPEGQLGERLFLEGFQELFKAGEEILPVIKKSKTLQKAIEHFKTDEAGYVHWKGYKLRTKAGFVRSNIINGNVS